MTTNPAPAPASPDVEGLIAWLKTIRSPKAGEAATALAALQSQLAEANRWAEYWKANHFAGNQVVDRQENENAQQAERIATLEAQLVELDHCRDSASRAEQYERERDEAKAQLSEAVGLLEVAEDQLRFLSSKAAINIHDQIVAFLKKVKA